VLALLISVLFWCAAGQDCKFTDPETGLNYNLLPLRQATNASENSFYFLENSLGEFYLNVCGAVNPSFGCEDGTAVCQKDTEKNVHSDGALAGFTISAFTDQDGSGVELVYRDGEECNNGTRSTHLKISCVPGAAADVISATQDEQSDCIYNIQMISEYGCPSNETQPTSSATPSVSPSSSVSSSVSPSASPSMSPSASASLASPSSSLSSGASTSPSPSTSSSTTQTASVTTTASPSASMSSTATASMTMSASASMSINADEEPPATPDEPGTWAWYFMIGVVILVLCLTALIAVAVILQKRRQDEVEFDPLDFD